MRRWLPLITVLLVPAGIMAAMTASQQSDALFKQSLGVGNSAPAKQFYEQPTKATPVVLPSMVWQDAASIPETAPGGADQQVTGVVKRWIDLSLTLVAGSTQAYTHAALADAIPFNFGDGTSYNYTVKDSTGAAIPFGTNDWILADGVLTFYAGAPANMPPKISFYQYVGAKGVGSGSGGVDLTHFNTYSANRQDEINARVTGTRFDGFSTGTQGKLDGKSPTGHLHPGTYEAANSNIQGHIASSANPHSTTASQVGAEPYLGTPTADADCLKSTTGGTRSWGACGSGGSVTADSLLDTIGTPYDRALLKQPGSTTSAVAQLVVRDCTGVPTYEVYSDGAVIIWSSPRLDDRLGTNAMAPFANQSTVSRSTTIYAKFRGAVFTLTTSNFRLVTGSTTVARTIWTSATSARVTPAATLSARTTYTATLQTVTNACGSVLGSVPWTFKTGD